MPLPRRLVGLVAVLAFVTAAAPAAALRPAPTADAASVVRAGPSAGEPFFWEAGRRDDYVLAARDTQSVEDHGGYTSEYIFGMTKGLVRSTLTPALKPVFMIFTVPLDLVFLPFAAIGGFFR